MSDPQLSRIADALEFILLVLIILLVRSCWAFDVTRK